MKKEMTELQPLSSLTTFFSADINQRIEQLAANHQVVIFYIPRQDKEILTIIPSILKHLHLGYEVHLVSYLIHSNEEFKHINQLIYRQNKEGNKIGSIKKLIDKQTFINIKNKEFIKSLMELGVGKENIHIYNSEKTASINELKCIIRELKNQFPYASHKSISFIEEDEQSSIWGKALLELYQTNEVANVNFYITIENKNSVTRIVPEKVNEEELVKLKKAAYSYREKRSDASHCTTGYKQLKERFEQLLRYPVSYVHGPDHLI